MSYKDLRVFRDKINLVESKSPKMTFDTPKYFPESSCMQKKFLEFLKEDDIDRVTYHFRESGACFFDREDNVYSMEVRERGAGKTTALLMFISNKLRFKEFTTRDFVYITPHPNFIKSELRRCGLEDITVVDIGLAFGAHNKKFYGSRYKFFIFDDVQESEILKMIKYDVEKVIYTFT